MLNNTINQQQGQAQVMGGYAPMFNTGMYNPMINPVQPNQIIPAESQNVQFLTAEQMAELKKQPIGFQGKLTREEYLRAICTHKDLNGHFSIEETKDGSGRVKCSICGAEWNLIDINIPDEEIEAICSNFADVFQSIKTYYGNVPESLREIYIIAGLINKIPQLWKVAKTYFEKSSNYYQLNPQNNQYGDNAFQNLSAMLGGVGAGFTMFNGMQTGGVNPYYAMNQQQPMYAPQQAPVYAPNNQFVQQNNGLFVPQTQQQPVQQTQQQTYGLGGIAQMGTNPIGYVEQNQVQPDFTNSIVQQPQQTKTTVQNVAMPGPSVANIQTPPMPEAPKNPNLQEG